MPTVSVLTYVHLLTDDGGRMPLRAHFFYSPVDPYAVRVEFFDRRTAVEGWHFDRQMMADGMQRRVGEGDVGFRPQWNGTTGEVRMDLRDRAAAGRRSAVLCVSAEALACFLERTYAVTPAGAEAVDLDAVLENLLAR